MATKPKDYPQNRVERPEFEWKAYDNYYSRENLDHLYFYHNDRRERRFVDCLMAKFNMKPGQTLLDLGCGNGFYSSLFQQRGMHVTGVDRSAKAIDYCKAKYNDSCDWLCADAFDLPLGKASCDYVFCFWFMYFNSFDNPADPAAAEAMDKLLNYVKPGGKLFFLWHTDLSAVRLPPDRFSVMNFTIAQMRLLFPRGYVLESYAVDSRARVLALLGRLAFNKYVTRVCCASAYIQASSWRRVRAIVVAGRDQP